MTPFENNEFKFNSLTAYHDDDNVTYLILLPIFVKLWVFFSETLSLNQVLAKVMIFWRDFHSSFNMCFVLLKIQDLWGTKVVWNLW